MNRRELLKALFVAPFTLMKLPERFTALLEEEVVSVPSFSIDEPICAIGDTEIGVDGVEAWYSPDSGKTWRELRYVED